MFFAAPHNLAHRSFPLHPFFFQNLTAALIFLSLSVYFCRLLTLPLAHTLSSKQENPFCNAVVLHNRCTGRKQRGLRRAGKLRVDGLRSTKPGVQKLFLYLGREKFSLLCVFLDLEEGLENCFLTNVSATKDHCRFWIVSERYLPMVNLFSPVTVSCVRGCLVCGKTLWDCQQFSATTPSVIDISSVCVVHLVSYLSCEH